MQTALDTMVDAVGGVTAAMGVALVVAPERSGEALGLTGPPRGIRAIGVADLVLAPMLLNRRRLRTPPMALRSLLNVVIAAAYGREIVRSSDPERARRAMTFMAVLTILDGGIALLLRRRERDRP